MRRLRVVSNFSGMTLISKATLGTSAEDAKETTHEPVAFPTSRHNPFQDVNIREIHKGCIGFIKYPIDLEEEIAQDYKV
jgi:hypothetical protein